MLSMYSGVQLLGIDAERIFLSEGGKPSANARHETSACGITQHLASI